jgi:hypothetical protein
VTDAEHKDFERLNGALEKIRQVVTCVNDSKRAEEEMEAMAKVIERLQGSEVRTALPPNPKRDVRGCHAC